MCTFVDKRCAEKWCLRPGVHWHKKTAQKTHTVVKYVVSYSQQWNKWCEKTND